MTQYEAPCPICGESVLCSQMDLMGFPASEPDDDNPLKTTCEACGAALVMEWSVTLGVEEQEEEE